MGARKGSRRYGKAAGRRVASAMRRRKRGTLRRGKGGRIIGHRIESDDVFYCCAHCARTEGVAAAVDHA
jgi:hypothetical protein